MLTNVYIFIGQCAYPIVAHCTGGETRQHLTKNNLPAAPWQGPVLVSLEDIGWLAKGDHQTSENTGNASPRPCFALEAPEKQIPHPDLVWYLKGAHTTAYLCASSLFFRSHFDRNVTSENTGDSTATHGVSGVLHVMHCPRRSRMLCRLWKEARRSRHSRRLRALLASTM